MLTSVVEVVMKKMMKAVADMMLSAVASGAAAMAMVALKYYAVKAVSAVNESLNGLQYADDP